MTQTETRDQTETRHGDTTSREDRAARNGASGAGIVLDVLLDDAAEAESLVRALERRDLDAAKDVETESVHVRVRATAAGDPLLIEPLVALETWLGRRDIPSATVHVNGNPHRVRARG